MPYQLDVLQLVAQVLHTSAHCAEEAAEPIQVFFGRFVPLLLRL